jgi:hypothetical protein
VAAEVAVAAAAAVVGAAAAVAAVGVWLSEELQWIMNERKRRGVQCKLAGLKQPC